MANAMDVSGGALRPLELLWLDPKHLDRIRRQPAFRTILDEARRAPPDSPGAAPPALPNQDVEDDDGRAALLVLARGAAVDGEGVAQMVAEAVREDGKFAPPLVLVAGELSLPFDEIDALKAAVTTATPFVGGDEPLRSAVDAAKEFLGLPDLSPSPAVIEAMANRIRDAFGRTRRAVPAGYLEAQIDRALLEQRRYQKRTFRGEPHLRALIQAGGDKGGLLVYLPEAVADKLPLYHRFGARVLAVAHLSVDQYETHPFALEALALAREVAAPSRQPAARR
jgi:hypothetical protein